jgi:hemerythrin family non-heme iron protein
MSFTIPEPYVWDESFKVFYDNLDEEHKGLFQGIFTCAKDPTDGKALETLATAVKTHFANEEAMMQKSTNYTEFANHKPLHDDFVKKLGTLTVPLTADQLHFAKEWLVNHIKGTDFGYKGKL